MASASLKDAFSGEVDDILDAFLLDMRALDRHTHNARSTVPPPSPAERNAIDPLNSSTRTKSTKKRLNPSWLKRKRELEALRAEAEELETRKEYLLSKVSRAETSLQDERRHDDEEEKLKCEAALDENGNLKQQLLRLSQSLTLVAMRTMAAQPSSIGSGAGYEPRTTSPSIFDVLEARIDARFRELEASLSAEQPATISNTSFVQSHSKSGGNCSTPAVEFKCTLLYPFAEDDILSTVWSFVEFGGFPDEDELHVTKLSENTCAADLRVILRLGDGGHAVLNAHRLVKHFVTPNGIVLMSEDSDEWVIEGDD